jgi:redox-sensitive bicupin YhaK (pirin superfamily)
VALPDRSRLAEPAFEHHGELPSTRAGGLSVTVLLGSLAGLRSPATTFTDIVGAELTAVRDASERIALAPSFEHAVLVTSGAATVGGADLAPGRLLYLAPGRDHLQVAACEGAALMVLGGVPLGEPLLMWWNFVARTPEEIAAAVADWREGRLGQVGGYAGPALEPPPLDVGRLIRRP